MTYPTIRGTTFCRIAAALGIALATFTLSNAAQADHGNRSHRVRDSAVHATRDTQAHRNRGDRSARRDIRRHRKSHAWFRSQNRWHRGHWHGQHLYPGRPRWRAGFFPGHIFRAVPHKHDRGCRIIRNIRFDHYGRKIITKRRVCYGRYGR